MNENGEINEEIIDKELLASFIPEEVRWIRNLEKNEKMLKEMEEHKEEFKAEIKLVREYNNWLEKILKYENLRLEDVEYYKPYKRLIRLYKRIPAKWMDRKNYEYAFLNGLYVVRTVYFFEAEKLRKYLKNVTKVNNAELGLPENYMLSTAKLISDKNYNQLAICISKEGPDDEIFERYIKNQRYSVWEYPII